MTTRHTRRRATCGVLALAASAALLGCDAGPSAGPDADLGADGDVSPDDPLALVPPVALEADPLVDCPAPLTTKSPEAGQNVLFDVGGQARAFWLVEPKDAAGPRPLLVAFGGPGEDGDDFVERARLDRFAERGFYVVAPSSGYNGSFWSPWDAMREPDDQSRPNRDLELFDVLVRCLAAHVEIDANRIYVAGHSAGGAMANAVLQRRSELLAGGVIASGIFRMTSPPDAPELDETLALVTFGGAADVLPQSSVVDDVSFGDEASAASLFYDEQPRVGQANCTAEVGHVWLAMLNDWMIDLLLAHPKGLLEPASLELAPVPEGSGATCTTEPLRYETGVQCPASSTDGCHELCDFIADCAVEVGVASLAGDILSGFGFSGEDFSDCSGCVSWCEAEAVTSADADVLACLEAASTANLCPSGFLGVQPLIDGLNRCCDGRNDAPYCFAMCREIRNISLVWSYFDTCAELLEGELPCDADGFCDPTCSLGEDPDCELPCVPDGICNPDCPPGADPDCNDCTVSDGFCDPECLPGEDPDCSDPCAIRDEFCDPGCPPMTDRDCPETCAEDLFCNDDACLPTEDPDCPCGVLDGACCTAGDDCEPGLACTELDVPTCLVPCDLAACDYGEDEGFCLPVSAGSTMGFCMVLEPTDSDCDESPSSCTTEYGVSTDTACLMFSTGESYCLETCEPLEGPPCPPDHICAFGPAGTVCVPYL